MKANGVKLTKRQKFFIAEYQKDFNGTQAAIRAGYSPKTAKEMAYKLVHKSSLNEVLAQEMDERLLRLGVRAERILEEVARVAFCDIRKLFNVDGSFKLPRDWDAETAAAVADFRSGEEFSCKGNGRRVIGRRKGIKLFDKVKALELLGRYLRLYSTCDQRGNAEVHVREAKPAHLSTLELAAKIMYLLAVAEEKMKQVEQAKQVLELENKPCLPQSPKG